jgi:hypothetical protein
LGDTVNRGTVNLGFTILSVLPRKKFPHVIPIYISVCSMTSMWVVGIPLIVGSHLYCSQQFIVEQDEYSGSLFCTVQGNCISVICKCGNCNSVISFHCLLIVFSSITIKIFDNSSVNRNDFIYNLMLGPSDVEYRGVNTELDTYEYKWFSALRIKIKSWKHSPKSSGATQIIWIRIKINKFDNEVFN